MFTITYILHIFHFGSVCGSVLKYSYGKAVQRPVVATGSQASVFLWDDMQGVPWTLRWPYHSLLYH